MKIIIGNKIRLKNPPDILQQMLLEQLRVVNPKFTEAQSAGRSVWGMDQYITNFTILPDDSLLIPRGMRTWLIEQSESLDIEFTVEDNRTYFDQLEIDSSKIKYRPYQFDAVLSLVSNSAEGVLVAPAGSGKTIMGLSIIPLVGQPALWVTHTGPLADQAIQRAEAFLPDIGDIGLIGKGKWKQGKVLTIAMVQTLVRNPQDLIKMSNDYGLVILDEAHHCPARTFLEVICMLNPYYLYGLTATPYRRDKLEQLMFQALGKTKTIVPMEKVEKYGGIIIPIVKYRAFRSITINGNDIQKILKQHIVENPKRNRMIVNDVVAEAKAGHYCIVISDRREHCEILYKMILDAWPKTGIATGKYTKKQIGQQVEDFNDNTITVLVATFALLGEGFDVPFLDRGFLSMPFRAEAKAEQLIGRLQRTYPGKEGAVLYDYVDEDVGLLKNQFFNRNKDCRHRTYTKLGVTIEQS